METQATVPAPTGNPLLDNPTLKAALAAKMAGQNSPPQGAVLPPGGQMQKPSPLGPEPQGRVDLPETMPSMSPPAHPSVSAPRGTVEGDANERSRLLRSGSGISQIAGKIEGSGLGQAHPTLGKVLGIGAQGLAQLGDIGLSTLAPAVAINTPGTAYHHQALVRGASNELSQDEANQEKAAQTADLRAQAPLRAAQTTEEQQKATDQPALDASEIAEHNAQASALLHPQAKTDFEAWQQQNPGRPIEDWLKAQSDSKVPPEQHVPVLGDDGRPTFANYSRGTWTGVDGKPIQNPRPIPPANAGGAVTMIVPGPDGQQRVERLQPGQVVAPGATTPGGTSSVTVNAGKSAEALKASKSSVDYANNYVQSGKFTGAGDEALLEKYFDLAKPSSGFRMSQQQISLLQNSRSWMDSAQGQAYHATTGTWFSPKQRQEIAETMNNLYQAKAGESGGGAPQGASSEVYAPDGKTLIGHVVNNKYVALGGK